MIESVNIRGLGVIEEASLPFGPGLTVVTGETGAGKTMVVTALGLISGARADSGVVRRGQDAAVVEATVVGASEDAAFQIASEAGAETDGEGAESVLYLSRTIAAKGRSRAHAGGRAVPVAVLGRIGESLLTVHGQTDQLRLRGAAEQRAALDAFAGTELATALAEYKDVYRELKAARAELTDVEQNRYERQMEEQTLQAALEEIDAVDPQKGEAQELDARSHKLSHIEELRTASATAHAALVSEEIGEAVDVVSLLDAAQRALESVDSQDPALAEQTQRLREVGYVISDIATELASYQQSLDADGPSELAAVEERRAALNALTRKYAPDVDAVIEWAAKARARHLELIDDPTRVEELTQKLDELSSKLTEHAEKVHELRSEAAQQLAQNVDEELAALAMPNAHLTIQVTETEPGPHGADEVAFLLAPHPGADPRPLGKGASGGELSRVMLALEVVLAATDPVPTFIFDEVDAGVGGEAAVEIGRRLARLARHVQVIVVTHLPQVAAFGDQHLTINKTSHHDGVDGFTTSDIKALSEDERVKELARMLAGQSESEAARAHAQELLTDAERERNEAN
ncbi:DNA repair protein RecN [Pseudoglutamicibacter cumminsii]|uniref:DNA repair protein RecN n=1 Tax=Pseudoglutamicibacter cumminsii TaxID=156979 RepID=UPI001959F435|nr:DNA repair protein RecN [Pseudoglutamicibacter cumminsii]MBM7796541.1 DNA repair protein RecN (Recombination protein N) [Pseudoglutamicibacter cumminsii]